MTKVASFKVEYTRFLDPLGQATQPLPSFARDSSELISLYQSMALTRAFDAKAIALQRTGRLGTFASSLGQEAVSVGAAHAMTPQDVLFPMFREHGAQLFRGVTLKELFLFWGGDERGNDFSVPRQDFPVCIPIGTHAAHAAGVALAMKLRGEARASVCIFGDGATSKGDIYEAMNLAGTWQLPVLFIINNNQWAISTPLKSQTATKTLAQKAIACGFDGEQVDGNDVIAVREAAGHALEKARAGGGPHLIEALSYRLGDHTTADDASRYRDDEDVSKHWKNDPMTRMRIYLTNNAGWSKKDEEKMIAQCAEHVKKAAKAYLATAPQKPESMFDNLYAELPTDLAAQRKAAQKGGETEDNA